METRRLGKTDHASTVVTFGAAMLANLSQSEADEAIDLGLSRGINHFDVAPTYGEAEVRLGDYLRRHHLPDLFISCKIVEREAGPAGEQLRRTLDRIGRSQFDLYQLHAVCNDSDLDACFASGGSMEAIVAAQQEGLLDHVGITGHGWEAADTHRKALDRFDFSTVMTACNRFMAEDATFNRSWQDLLAECQKRDVGIQVLKTLSLGPWNERERSYSTWYVPLDDVDAINGAVAWILNQPVATLCSAGDVRLLAMTCDAAEKYATAATDVLETLLLEQKSGDIFVNA